MKKFSFNKKIAIIVILALVLCAAVLSACDLLEARLVQISVEYTGGDIFVGGSPDLSKISVGAVYSNKDSREVTGWTLSDIDTSVPGVKTVTVTYTEDGITATDTFTVNVVKPQLKAIEVSYSGGDLFIGDELDRSKITVTAKYTDGNSNTVTDWTVDFDSDTAGTKTVTVTYTEDGVTATDTFTVNVVKPQLNAIEVSYSGGDLFIGDELDKSKITVTAKYTDGSSNKVTDWTVDFDSDTAGTKTVTVTYTEDGVTATDTFTVNVVKPQLNAIEVSYSGGDLFIGDELDKSKITVTAKYTDGSSNKVTDWTVDFDNETAGTKTVTVTYTEDGVTVTDTFTVNVVKPQLNAIEVSYSGGDLFIGDELDKSKITVTAKYTDGSSNTVTDWTSDFDSETAGTKTVTVTYTEDGVTATDTFTVNVAAAKLVRIEAVYSGDDVFVGDSVNKEDIRVTAYYEDGEAHEVTNFTFSPVSFDEAGEHTVTVSYVSGSDTVTAELTVRFIPLVPQSLSVLPASEMIVDYSDDIKIDPACVTVTILYTNGISKSASGFEITDIETLRGQQEKDGIDHGTFVVSYTENGVTLRSEPIAFRIRGHLVSMEAEYTGGDVYVGQTIDKQAIHFIARYDNGAYIDSAAVSNLSYTVILVSFDTAGTHTVTVTFEFDGRLLTGKGEATFQLEVLPILLESITAEYTGGEVELNAQPDYAKLVVTAHYNTGESKIVNNVNRGTIDSSTHGEKDWEISYTENDITKSCIVKITVVGNVGSLEPKEGEYKVDVIKNENLSIHFLMLGNKFTGDSIYIKAGETDVLIDAGSRTNSATTIANYINQYCTDGILEYVVATHAHQDHITGFYGSNSNPGIFDRYKCKVIIDFAQTNNNTTTEKGNPTVYGYYLEKRKAEEIAGANHYTANECIQNTNGASKEFMLADGITMEILDQRFYRDKTDNENNYSVCLMIKQGDNNYLFTGDLEDEGEESLVALNPNLPKVQLWKGGHHGSYTAASTVLMEKIQPQTICICTCLGTPEYTTGNNAFPAQAFIDRIAPYTDRVYCTSDGTEYKTNAACKPANGNIVFACTNSQITMYFSNNNTKLKDTAWFKANRVAPPAWS